MTAVALDTLKFAAKLEAGGFTPQQARAAAEAFLEATGDELATKADLQAVKVALDNRIALTECDLKIWLGKMVAWQISATAAIVGIATALLKLL